MIKKAVGFLVSFMIVIGVLCAFGVRLFINMQNRTMMYALGDQQIDGILEDDREIPVAEDKEEALFNEILTIVLIASSGMTIIFGIMLFSDIRNNKAQKEKLNMAIEMMIQKEKSKREHGDPGENVPDTSPLVPHTTRFELGGFVESEMNRLLIENYEGPDKKLTVMSDMNLLSSVIEKITDKAGPDVNVSIKAELAASIIFAGDNVFLDEEEIERISGIVTEAMGSFVFENNEAIIKLPIIPDFG
ncbi:MAG: hypothetical protein K6G47_12245 [Clostridia bacterium]|nr:hypothetical protein [Clostridia bacterium]